MIAAALIFQGQPGKLLTSPAPCPYRRRRTVKWNRPHLRNRKRWIFIPLLVLEKPRGTIPRGTREDSAIQPLQKKQKENACAFAAGCAP